MGRKKKAVKKKAEIPVPSSESNLSLKTNYGDLFAVKKLLEDQPELLDKKGANGCTPLIRAVRSVEETSEAVVEFLLDLGADIEVEAYGGMRAIHFSASNSRLGILGKLLAKADVHAVDASKNTALHWASRRPNLNPIKRLVEAGCKLDAKNSAGFTPLHLACSAGVIPTVKYLIEAGAADDAVEPSLAPPARCGELSFLDDLVWCMLCALSLPPNLDASTATTDDCDFTSAYDEIESQLKCE